MSKHTTLPFITLAAALACAGAARAQNLIANGGFETGFTGWTRADQVGSEGMFADQTGVTSPVNAAAVPAPPQGLHAAMTDGAGPGSHILYQDITLPTSVPAATLSFSLFLRNTAADFFAPATLDFATPTLNQQARVDILSAAADPFSLAPGDVLQTVYQSNIGSPLVRGYTTLAFNITPLLAARAGQTVRLRFAETDNVNIFNFGVDNVNLIVPAPSAGLLALPLLILRRRRR